MNFITVEEVRNPPLSKAYVYLYIICITAAGMSDWVVIRDTFGMYLKVFSLGGVGLAVLRMLWTSDFRRMKVLGELLVLFTVPLMFVYALSLALWSVNTMDTSYISRGTQKILFQFITVSVVMSAGYLFGSRAAEYTFIGLACANALMMAIEMVRYGVGRALLSIVESAKALSNAKGFLRTIEIHDITFCMGLFVMYFIFIKEKSTKNRVYLFVSTFFFILGFKRIAILSIIASIIAAIWLTRMKPKKASALIIFAQFALIVVSYVFVYLLSSGIWTEIMNKYEVDMMGRDRIYKYISQFYTLDFAYAGYGFEYTVAMLRGMRDSGTQVIHATAIHCDILKQYIELGFWGFLVWMIYTYIYQAWWYKRHFSVKSMILFFSSGIYAWITYMTDNTIYYFWISMTLKMLMVSNAFSIIENSGVNGADPRNFSMRDLAN